MSNKDLGFLSQYFSASARHYLDTACLGLISRVVREQVNKFINDINADQSGQSATAASVELFNTADECRKMVSKIVNCSPKEIALTESTTHGMQIIAASIPLKKGDNILIGDLEFLASVVPWLERCQREGVEIKPVYSKKGKLERSDFEEKIDQHTRAIVISSVQEINGFKANIEELGDLCKQYNAYLIVDGIQEVGALNINLASSPVDFYCAGGHKWLGSPFGRGFLYISKHVLPALQPPNYGYMALKEPEGGWDRYLQSPDRTPFDAFQFTNHANKYEIGGTSNFVGAFALKSSLEFMNGIGWNYIENRVLNLAGLLTRGLVEAGAQLCPGVELLPRSGIISFNLRGGIDAERRLVKLLEKERVLVSLRYVSGIGGIRVSSHFYNTEEDINKLLAVVQRFV